MMHAFRGWKLVVVINSFLAIFIIQAEPHLFKRFPQLQTHIPYVSLCDLPTPVMKLDCFGKYIGHGNFYIKRDDLLVPLKGMAFICMAGRSRES